MPITVLRQSATLDGLLDQGGPATPVRLGSTDPLCQFSGIDVPLAGAGNNACGIWSCTPGRFKRQLAEAEVMHILDGAGSFTPTDGPVVSFKAGDTLFFPANTTGEWCITETLRKVFVVMAP